MVTTIASGQVALLLLIFGDKLASEDLHLSIDGGLNVTNISNSGKTAYGLNFGVGLHWNLNDHWQFNPQFRPISQKGAKEINPLIPVPPEVTDARTRIKLTYIDVPVMMRYKINKNIFIASGFQVNFLSSAYQYTSGNYYDGNDVLLKVNTEDLFRKVDFGIPLEAGYIANLSTKHTTAAVMMHFFIRYYQGFTGIYKDEATNGLKRISNLQIGASFPTIRN